MSIFYLLEGSKILFMCSKYFIWIARDPIYLWKFFWNFWDFLTIFCALKYFLNFFGITYALKVFRKKKKNSSFPNGPSPRPDPIRARTAPVPSGQPTRPGHAHLAEQ
jgi:hypothetical protein